MNSVLLLFAPALALGSTIVALDEQSLSRRSDAIVFGTIVSTRTEVNDKQQVSTRAELQIYRSVRGPKAGELVTLYVPGGKLPSGLIADVPGAPKLAPGQLVFGFLENSPVGFRPLGLSYGLLAVHKAANGSYRASRDVSGLAMLGPGGAEVPPDVYRLEDVPLDELIARVTRHIGGLPAPEPVSSPGAVRK
jgi:hypothetical protein